MPTQLILQGEAHLHPEFKKQPKGVEVNTPHLTDAFLDDIEDFAFAVDD